MQFIQQLQKSFHQKVTQDPQNSQGHKNMLHFFPNFHLHIKKCCLIENQAHIRSQYQN